jgi:chromosome segregation ATPase
MNKEIEIQIRSIKEKILQLRSANQRLQTDNSRLQQIISEKEKELQNREAAIAKLHLQVQTLQLLQNNMNSAEKKEFTKLIDSHLAAIEETLHLLNE